MDPITNAQFTPLPERVEGLVVQSFDVTSLCPAVVRHNGGDGERESIVFDVEKVPDAPGFWLLNIVHLNMSGAVLLRITLLTRTDKEWEGFRLIASKWANELIFATARALRISYRNLIRIIQSIPQQ